MSKLLKTSINMVEVTSLRNFAANRLLKTESKKTEGYSDKEREIKEWKKDFWRNRNKIFYYGSFKLYLKAHDGINQEKQAQEVVMENQCLQNLKSNNDF